MPTGGRGDASAKSKQQGKHLKTIYKLNGKIVKKSEFEAFEKSLHGSDQWYCKTTKNGGITGWVAQDANGTRFNVKFDQSKDPALSSIEQEIPQK